VVFRKDSKVDAFQRQISALRHQLGGEHDDFTLPDIEPPPASRGAPTYRTELSALEPIAPDRDLISPLPDLSPELDRFAMSLPAVPAIDEQTSIVAHTTSWNGDLESSGSLHVHGRVEGSLQARDAVFIAEEAEVDAVISASRVTVAGNVRGSITCADRFEILPRGRVAGDVRAPVIIIHEGALIAGEIAMTARVDTRASVANARAVRGGA
jgi:cytoskeletal protein CcmA (bactofilin family)